MNVKKMQSRGNLNVRNAQNYMTHNQNWTFIYKSISRNDMMRLTGTHQIYNQLRRKILLKKIQRLVKFRFWKVKSQKNQSQIKMKNVYHLIFSLALLFQYYFLHLPNYFLNLTSDNQKKIIKVLSQKFKHLILTRIVSLHQWWCLGCLCHLLPHTKS